MTVTLDDETEISYDKLILAMGSHPFIPPVPGMDSDGVYALRTADDANAILDRLATGVSCVCIGGGILGLETAGALARRGGDVTLLESHDWLMPRQLCSKAAAVLEEHMKTLGLKVRKSAETQEVIAKDGVVAGVLLKSGETIDCGMVLVCTGVRSNTYLARKTGLEVNRGVVVDSHLVTSDPDILAAGDIAEHNGVVYGIWGPAQYQGTIAGMNACGAGVEFGGVPRSNALKVLGMDMLSIGQFTAEDGSYQVIEESGERLFRRFVFHDGRMVGCILLGDSNQSAKVKVAIEAKKDFSGLLLESPDCVAILERLESI
jgi:nitrite reductase (NADH) large subunit